MGLPVLETPLVLYTDILQTLTGVGGNVQVWPAREMDIDIGNENTFPILFCFFPMAAVKIITKTRKLSIYFQVSSRGPSIIP